MFNSISRKSANLSLVFVDFSCWHDPIPTYDPWICNTGHTWQLRKVKRPPRHRVALSEACDYERALLLSARRRRRRIRPRRERPLGMLSDGLSYKCSAETCPGRLQTCFCNAEPRILASQGAHLFSSPSLSIFSFFFSFLSTSRRRVARRGCPCTIESFRFYEAAIVGVIHARNTLRALCSRVESRKAFDNWKTRSERTDRLVSVLNIKRCLKEIFTNYGYLLHSYSKLISLDVTTVILYLSWKWVI